MCTTGISLLTTTNDNAGILDILPSFLLSFLPFFLCVKCGCWMYIYMYYICSTDAVSASAGHYSPYTGYFWPCIYFRAKIQLSSPRTPPASPFFLPSHCQPQHSSTQHAPQVTHMLTGRKTISITVILPSYPCLISFHHILP